MRIILCNDYEEVSKKAADFIFAEILNNPKAILGLATGSTPIGMYEELVNMYTNGRIDFSLVTSFNLDEYYKISQLDPQSYYYFMYQHFFSKVNINPKNIYIPNGNASDPTLECQRYHDKIIELGGIDIQILGVGNNGHIGFNEPDNYFEGNTHLVSLSEDTISSNARFFDSIDKVPKQALTMGMSEILQAKKLLLLITGVGKTSIVKELLDKKITTMFPVSTLKMHNNVVVLVDKEAADGLDL